MKQTPARSLWRWAVVAAYMVVIFVQSSSSAVSLPSGWHWDKVAHAAGYGLLSALAVWAATRGRLRATTWRVVLAAWIISTAYGVTDEVHQYFVPGRQADILDLGADAIGALAAAGAIRAWSIIARGSE